MAYKDMFTVLVVDSRIKRSRSLNDAFARILGHLRDVHHLRTDVIGTAEDAIIRLRNDASVACVLLEWGGKGDSIDGKRVVEALEDVGLEAPVFLVVQAGDLVRHHQGLLAGVVRGVIYPEEDTPDFVAKFINRHFEEYIEGLKPPFFGRVIEFTESSNEVWTCPGHNGGMFYRKSPVGHVFYEYLGEGQTSPLQRQQFQAAHSRRWHCHHGRPPGCSPPTRSTTCRSLSFRFNP